MKQPSAVPWKVDKYGDVVAANGIAVADCNIFHFRRSEEENRENARLIAAAPDLLEALKGVVAVADRKTVEFDRARAAIAKAAGRTVPEPLCEMTVPSSIVEPDEGVDL